jgi:hypothetical protein
MGSLKEKGGSQEILLKLLLLKPTAIKTFLRGHVSV